MHIQANQYTRRQALEDLTKAENNKDDAISNLKMIVDSLQPEESLEVATDEFIGVLNLVGNDSTESAQNAYKQVHRRTAKGEDRAEGLRSFQALHRAENNTSDAAGNFDAVSRSVDKRQDRAESTEGFNSVLNAVDNGQTQYARSAYGMVVNSLRPDDSILEGTESFVSIFQRENGKSDSVSGYQQVDRSLAPNESRSSATDQYLKILNTFGANETEGIQDAYRAVDQHVKGGANRSRPEATDLLVDTAYAVSTSEPKKIARGFASVSKSLRHDEPLAEALETFKSISRSENNVGDAISGYELVDRGLQAEESRAEATEVLTDLLKAYSSGSTDKAHSTYQQIQRRVAAGEDRKTASDAFLSNMRKENNQSDATGNFDTITQAVKRGHSRTAATAEFNNMLDSMGAEETKAVRSHFEMVVNSLQAEESLAEATQLHRDILRAENGFSDTESGYRMVNSAVNEKVSRAEATEYYVSLVKEYGSDNTSKAQNAFQETHEIILG